ncbi:MAG TPA: isoprenylcysteine carboxylmethyltransferase family protein [Reyranella sp.]|nr:isoprenylcysteine carboxylmethyltransferase family protein [Reyranella sp.]
MTLAIAVLLFVTLQRGAELVLARRNTTQLLKQGAVEVAPGHYPLIVALHAAWLIGLWIAAIAGRISAPDLPLLAVFAILQGLRLWVLVTLGTRWTTRILVMPGAPLIRRGPYRFLNHPNYAVVAGELLVLPLAFGLPWYAVAFSSLNAVLLWIRIAAEDRALRPIDTPSPRSS